MTVVAAFLTWVSLAEAVPDVALEGSSGAARLGGQAAVGVRPIGVRDAALVERAVRRVVGRRDRGAGADLDARPVGHLVPPIG